MNIDEFQVDILLVYKEKVIEGIVRSIEMTYSKRVARLPSSLDFDRLVRLALLHLVKSSCSYLVKLPFDLKRFDRTPLVHHIDGDRFGLDSRINYKLTWKLSIVLSR